MKKPKISELLKGASENEIYLRLQQHEKARTDEQEEVRRRAEHTLLENAPTITEYCRRREAQQFLIVEPDLPLDEMTTSDYIKVRESQNHMHKEPPLRMGEMSYAQYLKSREGR